MCEAFRNCFPGHLDLFLVLSEQILLTPFLSLLTAGHRCSLQLRSGRGCSARQQHIRGRSCENLVPLSVVVEGQTEVVAHRLRNCFLSAPFLRLCGYFAISPKTEALMSSSHWAWLRLSFVPASCAISFSRVRNKKRHQTCETRVGQLLYKVQVCLRRVLVLHWWSALCDNFGQLRVLLHPVPQHVIVSRLSDDIAVARAGSHKKSAPFSAVLMVTNFCTCQSFFGGDAACVPRLSEIMPCTSRPKDQSDALLLLTTVRLKNCLLDTAFVRSIKKHSSLFTRMSRSAVCYR